MRNRVDPRRYSKKIISKYLKRFLRERTHVLRPRNPADIEPVHRMRVASRRLRASLAVFEEILPAQKTKRWKKQIRKIGRALGRARELDIQIKFLEAAAQKMKADAHSANTKAIIKSLKKERQQAQEHIDIELGGFRPQKNLPGLKPWLKHASSGKRGYHMDEFNAQKGAVILRRLDQLRAFSPYVSQPKNIHELHRMRIAAKKLRYTLELLRPWYGAGIDRYIRSSRQIQDVLGDVHEFDVLREVVSGFSRKRDKDFNATVAYLTQECAMLRREAYRTFIRLWRHLQGRKLWEALRKDI